MALLVGKELTRGEIYFNASQQDFEQALLEGVDNPEALAAWFEKHPDLSTMDIRTILIRGAELTGLTVLAITGGDVSLGISTAELGSLYGSVTFPEMFGHHSRLGLDPASRNEVLWIE